MRVDQVARHERADRRERAEQVDVVGREADLLLRLAQRGRLQLLVGVVAAAARERDLAGVAAQVLPALREDRVQLVVAHVERDEHGRLRLASETRRSRLSGSRREALAQLLADRRHAARAQPTSSMRSSNMTSPSSVRWIGHFAAITDRRSTCSLVRSLGKAQEQLEAGGGAALGGRVLGLDLDTADVPALALGVHLDRDRRAGGEARGEQLLRIGGLVLAADVAALVCCEPVVAHVDLVRVGAGPSRGRLHHRRVCSGACRWWCCAACCRAGGRAHRSEALDAADVGWTACVRRMTYTSGAEERGAFSRGRGGSSARSRSRS